MTLVTGRSVAEIVGEMTFTGPCTSCGSEDHERGECTAAPEIDVTSDYWHGLTERHVVGWTARYSEGEETEWEILLTADGRIATFGTRRAGGKWVHGTWRGHQGDSLAESREWIIGVMIYGGDES